MSTIAVDNARPSAGGTAYSLTGGVAKAWVNFNGTGTIAVRGSLNVASLTDDATGSYLVNYTTNMADGNYSVVTDNGGTVYNEVISCLGNLSEPPSISTSNHSVVIRATTVRYDESIVMAQVAGDLA